MWRWLLQYISFNFVSTTAVFEAVLDDDEQQAGVLTAMRADSEAARAGGLQVLSLSLSTSEDSLFKSLSVVLGVLLVPNCIAPITSRQRTHTHPSGETHPCRHTTLYYVPHQTWIMCLV